MNDRYTLVNPSAILPGVLYSLHDACRFIHSRITGQPITPATLRVWRSQGKIKATFPRPLRQSRHGPVWGVCGAELLKLFNVP